MRAQHAAILELALVSCWIGAALLFTTVVAPAAFAALPSRTLAGAVVGRVLPALFYAGILIGVVVLATELSGGRRGVLAARVAGAAALALSCAIAQFVVGPRIARLRESIGGPLEALAADDARRAAFGRLHAFSVGWLALGGVAAVIVMLSAARAARKLP